MKLYVVQSAEGRDMIPIRGIFDNSDDATRLFQEIKDAGQEDAFVTEYETNTQYDTGQEPIKRRVRSASQDWQR